MPTVLQPYLLLLHDAKVLHLTHFLLPLDLPHAPGGIWMPEHVRVLQHGSEESLLKTIVTFDKLLGELWKQWA